jgi:hypothetical protein
MLCSRGRLFFLQGGGSGVHSVYSYVLQILSGTQYCAMNELLNDISFQVDKLKHIVNWKI